MGEKKDQIRRLDEEINRDGERNKELEKRLQVGIFPRVMPGERLRTYWSPLHGFLQPHIEDSGIGVYNLSYDVLLMDVLF